MATFKSSERIINAGCEAVYRKLSNLEGFQKVSDNIPEELKGQAEFHIDGDNLTLSTKQIGDITFKITKRVENERIKLETVSSPLPFSIEILFSHNTEDSTKLMVETKIELNPIIKPMISKPIQEMTEKFAEFLSTLPYGE